MMKSETVIFLAASLWLMASCQGGRRTGAEKESGNAWYEAMVDSAATTTCFSMSNPSGGMRLIG